MAQPHPATRERNAAHAGTQRDELSGAVGTTCLRVRRILSLMLDGEAAAPDVARIALHLRGCTCCRQFAAGVAAFTHRLRATQVEHPSTNL